MAAMMFYPGQKIVCVNDNWLPAQNLTPVLQILPPVVPKKGSIYHFGGVDPVNYAFIFIEEIPRWHHTRFGSFQVVWHASHFRPLDERSTDISIFKKLLVPAKGKERVREDA
jgi:hypothetical protein